VRRLAFALALALALVAAAGSAALAKPMVGTPPGKFGERASADYQSSQWFAFELKFSPYTPHIDQSAGLTGTPFLDLFTSQFKSPRELGPHLLTQLEFDFQFFHKFGSLGVGATLGFYRRTTHAFVATDPPCEVPSCQRSGDETALNVVPMSLLLVYRFDVLALRYRVPLVPYFKIGLAYYAWFIQNGSGGIATATIDGQKRDGYGGSFGWVLNPGLAFLLDIIDPRTARTMDAELGINHTYLFCELHYADVDGFRARDRMNLSDLTLNAGIAFEF
jgi:hypothetical protein